ncbi:hypothetical protein [Streptomyces sp. NPDC008139]|uniref:hypothetical protein n=1 Tax=Streptomyces sp. NPDC008139 TaxID=3364814 RepID=UPI0036F0936A
MASAIQRIEEARASGLAVTANVYPYEAVATGLDACIPPRFHDGGPDVLRGKPAPYGSFAGFSVRTSGTASCGSRTPSDG